VKVSGMMASVGLGGHHSRKGPLRARLTAIKNKKLSPNPGLTDQPPPHQAASITHVAMANGHDSNKIRHAGGACRNSMNPSMMSQAFETASAIRPSESAPSGLPPASV